MSQPAQVIVAVGVAGLLLLLGALGVIWSLRCDPRRPHYRLPSLVVLLGPATAAILAWLKLR